MSFLTTVRDLLRYNLQFAIGATLTLVIVILAGMSFFSPYNPLDTYVVALDAPPSWQYPFGTTSRGQDAFWLLTFALRNTLLFGITVAVLSRLFSLTVGLVAGYVGGRTDRVLMATQRHLHRDPALPDPGSLLLRPARLHELGPAGSGHGQPRLGL